MTVIYARVGFNYRIAFPDDYTPEQAIEAVRSQSSFPHPPEAFTDTETGRPSVVWEPERVQWREFAVHDEVAEENRLEPDATNMAAAIRGKPMDRDNWWEGMNILQQEIWPNAIDGDKIAIERAVGQASPEYAMELRMLLRDLVEGIEQRESNAAAYDEALAAASAYLRRY